MQGERPDRAAAARPASVRAGLMPTDPTDEDIVIVCRRLSSSVVVCRLMRCNSVEFMACR